MATFFNNFDDFKPYIGSANINFDINVLESYIQDAIDKNLVPYLGQAYVDDCVTKYKANSSNADYVAVLPYLRSCISQFTLLYWSQDSKLNISDDGLTRKENESAKSAFQWQSNEFKQARNNTGWQRFYQLIVYLETNVANAGYDLYEQSQERKWLTDRMVWKLTEISKVKSIENYETVIKLLPYLTVAEEELVKPAITDAVFTTLKTLPTATANVTPYRYAIGAIVNHAIFKAKDLPFRISGNGIFIDTIDSGSENYNKSTQNLPDVQKLRTECAAAAKENMYYLQKYLDENCSVSVFPTYKTDIYDVAVAAEATLAELKTNLSTGTIPIL